MSGWNPNQYMRFGDHRLRPALDLISQIPDIDPRTVWDLGCGPGNVTKLLADRWTAADVVGLDSSPEMLAKASTYSGVTWGRADIAHWSAPRPADLIFSNATLQWLPDHGKLLPHLVRQLRDGGILAVQMPRNSQAPSHQAILDTVSDGKWRDALQPAVAAMPTAEGPDFYYTALTGVAASLDIWETEYLQILEGENAVAEWTKGSVLKPFIDALGPFQGAAFYEDYVQRLSVTYPRLPNGRTLFPFKRLFLVAKR